MDDAADHQLVIDPRNTARLVRQQWSSRSNCSSLDQNSLKSTVLPSPSLNHIRDAKGTQFMASDPAKNVRPSEVASLLGIGRTSVYRIAASQGK